MKHIKFSDVLKINKPEYVFLRLKPNNSIRNTNSHKLARAISSLHKNVLEDIKKENEKIFHFFKKDIGFPTQFSYQVNSKISYYIYIEHDKVGFYFIIPKHHLPFIKEKISDVWTNITIDEVNDLPSFGDKSTKFQLVYEKEDALSIISDRRDNSLLNSNLNVIEMLKDGDKVGIFYNFIPSEQNSWQYSYKNTIEKVKKGLPVNRNKMGIGYLFMLLLSTIDGLIQDISNVLSGEKEKFNHDNASFFESLLERVNGGKQISDDTKKKLSATILPTQIAILSESNDYLRQRNNARSLAQSFDTVSGDNKLIYKSMSKKFKFTEYSIGAERNKIGDLEANNFLSIAGREILERYNFIEKIETQETQIPDDLKSGVMCIGENTFRGKIQKAYLSNDKEFRNLLLLLIGPTRAGKSNLIGNLSIDAIENGECVIIFDFIKNCELSEEVSRLFPTDKVLEIRCDDPERLQGLGYNEVGVSNDVFKRYENAKKQTANMLALVNAINPDESRLSPKMERYLESASLITFLNHGSIRDVFNVLQNHVIRHDFINKVPKNQYDNLQEYIDNLCELDDYKEEKIKEKGKNSTRTYSKMVLSGTKDNLIVGVIDRLNILKRNTYMELMLKKGIENNIDLSEEMQKNQLITIRMPELCFPTEREKDICTTYWITKIWLALQVRADKVRDISKIRKVNLVIDELYQVENTERFLTSKLSQIAKFIMKPIVSCHYINQLRIMRDELRSANTSYMLISGCDKKNYDELKNELYPFTDEDLMHMKRHYSMNYIKDKNGYSRFITKLPGKVENRIRQEVSVNEQSNLVT